MSKVFLLISFVSCLQGRAQSDIRLWPFTLSHADFELCFSARVVSPWFKGWCSEEPGTKPIFSGIWGSSLAGTILLSFYCFLKIETCSLVIHYVLDRGFFLFFSCNYFQIVAPIRTNFVHNKSVTIMSALWHI